MKQLLTTIADFLFPKTCFSCWVIGDYLCPDCKKWLQAHPEVCPLCHRASPHYHICPDCSWNCPWLAWIMIAFQYTWILKKLIRKLKYDHRSSVAVFLAERISRSIQTNLYLQEACNNNTLLITYVPSHRRRHHIIKWYNQSLLLAQQVSKILDLPFRHIYTKTKHTKSQAKLSRKKRLSNLHQAFTLHTPTALVWNETIIIIDDITTTWSTIKELTDTIHHEHPDTVVWWLVVGRHGK